MTNILVVTNSHDLHADLVAGKINERKHNAFVLKTDRFPVDYYLDLRISDGLFDGLIIHRPTDTGIQISDIKSVWMRKKGTFSYPSGHLAPQEKAYADGEMEHILFSMLCSLNCYWMSHPLAVRASMWKGEQLQRAVGMGFLVPRSLITNKRSVVEAFRRSAADGIVFKSLSSASLAAEKVGADDRVAGSMPTTRITAEHEELLDAVSEAPCFFQELVPKACEIRATVIDGRVFAAKIHSQDDPRTRIDYRDFSADILYEATTLPTVIEERCRAFVASYGLNYGAIDLIVTPEGDYVFLENNPVGQFLFVEQLVPSLDMSGWLAECLIRGAQAP
jgi:glutathione synthase/RimK-type ligase-like ATP-grasp enzyme